MINSKGETIYTSAEIAYELGIAPGTVNAIGRRLFGNRIAHLTLSDAKLICEYLRSISIEEDAKRLAALHTVVESVMGQTKLDSDDVAERVKKDLHNVN